MEKAQNEDDHQTEDLVSGTFVYDMEITPRANNEDDSEYFPFGAKSYIICNKAVESSGVDLVVKNWLKSITNLKGTGNYNGTDEEKVEKFTCPPPNMVALFLAPFFVSYLSNEPVKRVLIITRDTDTANSLTRMKQHVLYVNDVLTLKENAILDSELDIGVITSNTVSKASDLHYSIYVPPLTKPWSHLDETMFDLVLLPSSRRYPPGFKRLLLFKFIDTAPVLFF